MILKDMQKAKIFKELKVFDFIKNEYVLIYYKIFKYLFFKKRIL